MRARAVFRVAHWGRGSVLIVAALAASLLGTRQLELAMSGRAQSLTSARVSVARVRDAAEAVEGQAQGLLSGAAPVAWQFRTSRALQAELAAPAARLEAIWSGPDPRQIQSVGIRLNAAVRRMLALVALHRLPAARAVNATVVDPTYARLGRLLDLADRRLLDDANEADTIGWAATLIAVLVATAILAALVVGLSCARRRHEHAERERQLSTYTEQRLQALLENSSVMIVIVASDSTILLQTGSVASVLGREPAEIHKHALTEWAAAEDVPGLLGLCATRDHQRAEIHLRHRDGQLRTCEIRATRLQERSGWEGVVLNIWDVTEHKKLELELRLAQKLEAVGQLAAGIAHEINTPMQFVNDSLAFLERSMDELLALVALYRETLFTDQHIGVAERRRTMAEAEEEADLEYLLEGIPAAFRRTQEGTSRVTSIVKAMKRFSHPADAEMAPADLNDAIETTLTVCRNEYKYVADLNVDLGDLPLVTCNAGELGQVFLNLIINAAQAIEEKLAGTERRGTITIMTMAEGGEVVIRFCDDGPGIPIALQQRIYEPFFTTKEVGKGSGQGLALARSTIEQHAGSIECESAPGEGTVFTIRLPVDPPATGIARAA